MYKSLVFSESLWFRGIYRDPCKSKYISLFKNFDPEKIYDKNICDDFIFMFGDESLALVKEALISCDLWIKDKKTGEISRTTPMNNVYYIYLANAAHGIFLMGCNESQSELGNYPLSKITDANDWLIYIGTIADGYEKCEKQRFRPSQLIAICVLLMIDRALSLIQKDGFNKLSTNALLMAYRFLLEVNGNDESIFFGELINKAKLRARKGADALHVETRILKQEVQEFWIASVPSSLSNDDAAAILIRQFPLKFRTLSGYVSEFKKTLC